VATTGDLIHELFPPHDATKTAEVSCVKTIYLSILSHKCWPSLGAANKSI